MSDKHYAVVWESEKQPQLVELNSPEHMAEFVRSLSEDTMAYLFSGRRPLVSAGPFRYLDMRDGSAPIRLFDEANPGLLDTGPTLGREVDPSGAPQVDPAYARLLRANSWRLEPRSPDGTADQVSDT